MTLRDVVDAAARRFDKLPLYRASIAARAELLTQVRPSTQITRR